MNSIIGYAIAATPFWAVLILILNDEFKTKRHGGLLFFRIGRFGGSFYIAKESRE